MSSRAIPREDLQLTVDTWAACRRRRGEACQRLGMSEGTLDRRLKIAKREGVIPLQANVEAIRLQFAFAVYEAQQGWSPENDIVHRLPEGLTLKGTSVRYGKDGQVDQYWNKSRPQGRLDEDTTHVPDPKAISKVATLYDQQGRVTQQWVSEKPEEAQLGEFVRQAVAAYLEGAPQIEVGTGPAKFDTDVIPWFQIGDAHIGMLAHEAETGANFDLKIAEREICAAFSILFDECPTRERCVINDAGDFTHYENLAAVTEASGHRLDADGRFPKMIGVYVRIMRFIVDRALEKFQIVDIIVNQGNHSRTNDIWMAELLRQVYAHTARVNVLSNANVFIPYRMGNTFVMTHHGDKTKPERLVQVMSNDFARDWGETDYHYIDVGHLHHKWAARESAGCVIEQWNTLAAKDKWSNDAGYRSQQSITRVDRSKTYGEVGRRVLPIKEIRDVIAKSSDPDHYVPRERRQVFTV